MGKRGPAPTPTHLKILNGSALKHPSRINKNEPQPEYVEAEPPNWLKGRSERKVYREEGRKLARMKVLTEADQRALAMVAIYWVKWEELAKEATTAVHETENGYVSTDPRINSMVKLGEKIMSLFKEFGMTPSSRTGLEVQTDDKYDDLEAILNGN